MKKKFQVTIAIALTMTLVGCGLKTYSSGVMKMGPDTYTVSANDLNMAVAQKSAMQEASMFCQKLDKEILVTNRSSNKQGARRNYEVTFMCLDQNDRELHRPKYESEADIVIHNK